MKHTTHSWSAYNAYSSLDRVKVRPLAVQSEQVLGIAFVLMPVVQTKPATEEVASQTNDRTWTQCGMWPIYLLFTDAKS